MKEGREGESKRREEEKGLVMEEEAAREGRREGKERVRGRKRKV